MGRGEGARGMGCGGGMLGVFGWGGWSYIGRVRLYVRVYAKLCVRGSCCGCRGVLVCVCVGLTSVRSVQASQGLA